VYVLPGLVGAGLAAMVYDVIATPRRVTRPIREAVTTPDTAPAPSAAAVR
jgi:glycerol uptake facilitator protein